ncbi:MAG: hypothetical protein KDA65_18375 [Planctomycetaceae bacterium]|nr:hypothetical protein [Planctomycetaceae bacterium]
MSGKYQLDSTDFIKIAKGALIAGIAAILAYFAQALGLTNETVNIVNGSEGEPMVVDGIPPVIVWWILSIGVNLFRKWFFDNTKEI